MAAAVNLARRPFANTRHLRRLGIALWVVGALLLALDGFLYWQSLFGIEGKKEERAELDREIAAERERIARAEEQLSRIDLEAQNVEASYLNLRIAERTFGWSEVFRQLAEVLPLRVRLYSLAPAGNPATAARAVESVRRASAQERRGVEVVLTGVAESDEALLELIDNLFASPAFDDPRLPVERRQPQGVEFTLHVLYLPPLDGRGVKPAPRPTVVEEAGAGAPVAATPPVEGAP